MKKYPDLLLMIFLVGATLFFSFSTKNRIDSNVVLNKSALKIINPAAPDSLFRSGDLIFRDGRGFISSIFRKLSLIDPRYSHAGIIHKEEDKIYVFHIIGGEGNKNNHMRKDLLGNFCSPLQSNAFAVYRTDLNGKKIDSLAEYYFSKKIEFDTDFNLESDDKMYCTELLYKVLKKVSGQDNFLPLSTISGIKYPSCDNIYLSIHSKKIYSIEYTF